MGEVHVIIKHRYVPLGNINRTAYDSAVRKSD